MSSVTGEICSRSVTASIGYFSSHDRYTSSQPLGFGGSLDTKDARRQAGALASIAWAPFDRFEVGVSGSLRNQTIGDASIANFFGFPFVFGSTEQSTRSISMASASARYEVWKGNALGARHIVSIAEQVEHVTPYRSSVYLLGSPPTLLGTRSIKGDWHTTASLRTSHNWEIGKGFTVTARTLGDLSHHQQSSSESARVTGRVIAAYAPFGIAIGPEYTFTTTFGAPGSLRSSHYAGARLYLSPSSLLRLDGLLPLTIEVSARRLLAEARNHTRRISSGLGMVMENSKREATDFSAVLRYRLEY